MPEWGNGGAEGNRTPDLDIANVALSQLSYGPINVERTRARPKARYCERERWLSRVGGPRSALEGQQKPQTLMLSSSHRRKPPMKAL